MNYKEEVLKIYPDASIVVFDNSALKCHVRLYPTDSIPVSLGKGDTEQESWESAYNNLKSKGIIKDN